MSRFIETQQEGYQAFAAHTDRGGKAVTYEVGMNGNLTVLLTNALIQQYHYGIEAQFVPADQEKVKALVPDFHAVFNSLPAVLTTATLARGIRPHEVNRTLDNLGVNHRDTGFSMEPHEAAAVVLIRQQGIQDRRAQRKTLDVVEKVYPTYDKEKKRILAEQNKNGRQTNGNNGHEGNYNGHKNKKNGRLALRKNEGG